MDKKHKIKIGMIGLGYWGKNILRNLCELDLIHTACDVNQEIIDKHKCNYPDMVYCTDPMEIFKNPDIDAVFIASPASTHYEFAKQALNADKDIFVEKPLSLTVPQGQELVQLAAQREKILMVGHILQYHSAVIKLKELIKDGTLGKVQYIYSNRLNMGKLRVEENILWSFAPHDISVILMLTGEEPTKVTCSGGSYLNDGIYDTTMTTLEFRNKIRAHIFVSWLHPFKEQKFIIIGSQGMAVFDDMVDNKLCIYPHKIRWEDGKIPIAEKAECQHVDLVKTEPLKEEIQHFVECVINRKAPKTDGQEGMRVLKVLEAAELSLAISH